MARTHSMIDPFDDSGSEAITLCTDSYFCPDNYLCCRVQEMRFGWGCCTFLDGKCCPSKKGCVGRDQNCEEDPVVPLIRSKLVDEISWLNII